MANLTPTQQPSVAAQNAIAALVNADIDRRHPFTPPCAREAAVAAVMAEMAGVITRVVTDELLAQHSFQLRRPRRKQALSTTVP